MEQVFQESAKIRHISSPKQLELPKINVKDVVTFHNGEQNEKEDVTKNTELKIARPIGNHQSEL